MSKLAKGHFTGHNTFVFRYSWPTKVIEALKAEENKGIFGREDAIATFGVGKNMVNAMQHWCHSANLIEPDDRRGEWKTTDFGELLFNGYDPFGERSSTPWLLHWQLTRPKPDPNSEPKTVTTIWWFFNHYTDMEFGIDRVLSELQGFLKTSSDMKNIPSDTTLRRDLDCTLRTYLPRKSGFFEEDMESVLAELRLLERSEDGSRLFRFRRTERNLLPDEVFAYMLIDFWNQFYPDSETLPFDVAMYGAHSPGMALRLNEDGMLRRIRSVEKITKGKISWSETAGLRQWQRSEKMDTKKLLRKIYHAR